MRSVESIALMTIIFAFILYFADTKNKDTISELKSIKSMGYSDEFLRIWEYYFIYCGSNRKLAKLQTGICNYSRHVSQCSCQK